MLLSITHYIFVVGFGLSDKMIHFEHFYKNQNQNQKLVHEKL